MKSLLVAINSKYIHPGYGVYQIVANSKYPVDYIEFTIKDNIESIIEKITKTNYDLLGFSVYIWNVEIVKRILKHLEQINFNGNILLGGPEVSYQADYFFTNFKIDYIIKNEGEESFNELLEYLQNLRPITNVSNLYYQQNNQVHFTYDKLPDINNIKPAHHFVDDLEHKIIYFESSRGCCFNCTYCMASLEPRIRPFPLDLVKSNLSELLRKKVKTIKFLDRSFNIHLKNALEILKFLIENDNNYSTIQFEVVGDILNRQIIDYIIKYARPGYFRFEIGVQTTNPQTTKAIRRTLDFEKLAKNINLLRDKVGLHLDLIAGLPYENKESFKKSFNDTFLLFPHELQLGFLKELKGTQISKEKELHQYVFSNTAPYEVIENKYISKEDLEEIRIVEKMVNRLYNRGLFNQTIHYLVTNNYYQPYDFFFEVGVYFINNNLNSLTYQLHELFLNVYNFLKTNPNLDSDYILFLLKQDYLSHFKIRPKIWWDNPLTPQEKKYVFQKMTVLYPHLNMDMLYRYCRIEKYQNQYYAILYLPNKVESYCFTI
ncbi:MAG TPA: radical SAM protein [Bacilli bacterium]|nr:radical SAM protein [Bacilli bacterium]